jgi:hypothetical protein
VPPRKPLTAPLPLHFYWARKLVEYMTTSTDTVMKEAEGEVKDLADRDANSVNSNIRYMAYGSRLRTALVASSRYVAYVSSPSSYHIVLRTKMVPRQAMLVRRLGRSCTRVLSLLRKYP